MYPGTASSAPFVPQQRRSSVESGSGVFPSETTTPDSQEHLDPAPVYDRAAVLRMQPDWGDRFFAGLKKVGLGVGTATCGLLAIGLLPLTIVGGILYAAGISSRVGATYNLEVAEDVLDLAVTKEEKEQAAKTGTIPMVVGMILAAPVAGLYLCVREVMKDRARLGKSKTLALHLATSKTHPKELRNADSVEAGQILEKIEDERILGKFERKCKKLSKDDLLTLHQYLVSLRGEYGTRTVQADLKGKVIEIVNQFLDEKSR